MGATPTYDLPYPELTDTPDVPRDMSALATAVDGALGDVAAAAHEPMTFVRRVAAQPCGAQVPTVIAWDTEVLDELGIWSAADPTALIVAQPGWYRVDVNAVTSVLGLCQLLASPVAKIFIANTGTGGSGLGYSDTASMPALLAAGDRVTMTIFPSVAGNVGPAALALTKLD